MARLYSEQCKVLLRVSSTSHILFHPPLPAHSEQRTHFTSTVFPPYFVFITSMKGETNLRADHFNLHISTSPIRRLHGPHHLSLLPVEKGRDGHYALLQSRAFWCAGADLSAKHISIPWSHEQRWWNKVGYLSNNGQLLSVWPWLYALNSFQGDFSNCTEALHG